MRLLRACQRSGWRWRRRRAVVGEASGAWAVIVRGFLSAAARAGIPAHTDPVGAGAHWRLNVVIAGGPGAASAFYLEGPGAGGGMDGPEGPTGGLAEGDALIFRPDRQAHGVRAGSERWVWSVGCRIGRGGGNGV